MTDPNATNPPSSFVSKWLTSFARRHTRGRRALDVACGRGRHALAMAAVGFHVTGVDLQFDALASANASAKANGTPISLVCADLTTFVLPEAWFDLVVVCRYLDRDRFSELRRTLSPGGVLLYETFTERQLELGRGPRSREHLLKPGELRSLVLGMDVLFDEEVTEPEALARIAARRR